MLRRNFLEFLGIAPIAAQALAVGKHDRLDSTLKALNSKFGEPLSSQVLTSTRKFKVGSSTVTELIYHKKDLTIRIRDEDSQTKLIYCGAMTANVLQVRLLKPNWTTQEIISTISG